MSLDVQRFDRAITDPAIHQAFNRFDNLVRADEDPTFPARRLDETAAILSEPPSHIDRSRWLVFDGAAVVGATQLDRDREDAANLHVGWCEVDVIPEFRRRGIGRRLTERVGVAAADSGRTVVMAETSSLVPAGEAFAVALGAEPGLAAETSELRIDAIDLPLMEVWIEQGRLKEDRFRLFWVDGPWPEALRPEVLSLTRVMNDAPLGDLDVNDQQLTVATLISFEDELRSRRIDRMTAVVEQRATGRLVGFTQVFINPSFPDLLQQGDTGVFPEFRGTGLGKWLKAAMVRRITGERPEIMRIRTENATANAPMLAINHAMGFTLHHTNTVWQIASQQLARTWRSD